jgi:hypothetical protein
MENGDWGWKIMGPGEDKSRLVYSRAEFGAIARQETMRWDIKFSRLLKRTKSLSEYVVWCNRRRFIANTQQMVVVVVVEVESWER